MFDFFRLARYRITISAGPQGLSLPPYKGAVFRGGFGSVFRRVACALREQECLHCLLKENCPYAYIFETSPPADTQALRNYESIPRPFVLEPPVEIKTDYSPGERLDFNLVLIGRAIDYLPYFVVVFREMGQAGLGRGRRPFILEEVTALGLEQTDLLYTRATNTVRSIDLSYSGATLIAQTSLQGNQLRVEFETPIRLVDGGRQAEVPEFHIFFRQALRRISALAYFHHGHSLDADYAGLAERSRRVTLVENKTRRHGYERFSRRQNQRINMGGLVGTAVYEGNLAEFLPWLALGEHVHVGKNTVFGLGKYRIDQH
jgi:hypothetical protein